MLRLYDVQTYVFTSTDKLSSASKLLSTSMQWLPQVAALRGFWRQIIITGVATSIDVAAWLLLIVIVGETGYSNTCNILEQKDIFHLMLGKTDPCRIM